MQAEQMEERIVLNSPMGGQRKDYEAFYHRSDAILLAELHNHEFYEIYFCLHGGRTLHVNNHIYTLRDGCMMIFPPFQIHGIVRTEMLYDYERAVLYIAADVLKKLGYGLMDFTQLLQEKAIQRQYQFYPSQEAIRVCTGIIRRMADRGPDRSPMVQVEDHMLMTQLFLQVARVISESEGKTLLRPTNELIQRVQRYMDENYASPLTLDSLAARFNVSKSLLSHEFSRCTNSSVYEYILFRRVTRAKELLLIGCRCTDVAFQCGFGDYSSFLRAFKRIAGVSPSDFTNRLLQGKRPAAEA